MGQNKKVNCGKCLPIMRRDNLKTHMKQHEKEKFEKESSSIATSRTSLQEETYIDFSSVSTNTSIPINEEFVKKRLKMNNDEYNTKMELGKIIAKPNLLKMLKLLKRACLLKIVKLCICIGIKNNL